MAKEQPWKDEGLTKAEWIEREVAAAVNAGKAWDLETVDFSDPNRPLTCLEVDFPIIPINQIAAIEASSGAAKKPIYQMSKWWARRQSSVFRAMLIAGLIPAPDDPSEAAKLVWDVYYGNHQGSGCFDSLRVADIFMGGGTTLVEGARLGLTMHGTDLSPIAWMIVRNELADVSARSIATMLSDIENEVRPQVMPFVAASCPRGHCGKWTHLPSDTAMGEDFVPESVPPSERDEYCYEGPETIYTFWAKHGPCSISGCEHRTPIMSKPVIAEKTLTIKSWPRVCKHCGEAYDIEAEDARLAPGCELVVGEDETKFSLATMSAAGKPVATVCPNCDSRETLGILPKPVNKKIKLSVVLHPAWLNGQSSADASGIDFGGRAKDDAMATCRWLESRAKDCKLIEFRGDLPDRIELASGEVVPTDKSGGTVAPGVSKYACRDCGAVNNVLDSVERTGTTGPIAPYAYQVYCPECEAASGSNGGRYFVAADNVAPIVAACREWEERSTTDLSDWWPRTAVPDGERTTVKDPLPRHGFKLWRDMFNDRQLLIHSQLLRAIGRRLPTDEALVILGAFQQYLRLNNLFSIWHIKNNQISASLSNSNFNPKSNSVEPGVFAGVGDGSWRSATKPILSTLEWREQPTELGYNEYLMEQNPSLKGRLSGRTTKIPCDDPVLEDRVSVSCGSSTDLHALDGESFDLVVTDPPFGGILQYAELADFFYVWLRLALSEHFPEQFAPDLTPKATEAVSNTVRHEHPDDFYKRVMTECWREAARILKPGGTLAFTFHHSEDAAWVAVLESLFDAGFFLEATYPIRSDESKGANAEFGSKLIEYDVIHVCRQRTDEPTPISWAKLRRHVIRDVRDLQSLLEHHQEDGLPEADLQVIRRGKALEYFSRHYGQVYKNPDTPMSVLEALLGINQLLDEEAGGIKEPPPHNAEPFTRMMLRLFDGAVELPRDQMQKFLRGTGSAPSDFIGRGWVTEKKKVFYLVPPLDIAREWVGKQRRGMTSDYDQAMYLIGACFENSGIIATDTLNNANFRPHPALGAILTWFKTHGADSSTRNAAITASQLYKAWEAKNQPKAKELTLFDMLGEDD